MRNVVHWLHLSERRALYAPFPAGLDDRLRSALVERGLKALYTHQALAIAAALRGEHVTVVTGPARWRPSAMRTVIVGIDGSATSTSALDLAAEEAAAAEERVADGHAAAEDAQPEVAV